MLEYSENIELTEEDQEELVKRTRRRRMFKDKADEEYDRIKEIVKDRATKDPTDLREDEKIHAKISVDNLGVVTIDYYSYTQETSETKLMPDGIYEIYKQLEGLVEKIESKFTKKNTRRVIRAQDKTIEEYEEEGGKKDSAGKKARTIMSKILSKGGEQLEEFLEDSA